MMTGIKDIPKEQSRKLLIIGIEDELHDLLNQLEAIVDPRLHRIKILAYELEKVKNEK